MQSCYAFRGAHPNSIARLVDQWHMKIYHLTWCFRCPSRIVQIARKIDRRITGGWPDIGPNVQIRIVPQAINWIWSTLLTTNHWVPGYACILFRNNDPIIRLLYLVFQRRSGVPIGWLAPMVQSALDSVLLMQDGVTRHTTMQQVQLAFDSFRRDEVHPALRTIMSLAMSPCHGDAMSWLEFVHQVLHASLAQPAMLFATVHAAKGLEWEYVMLVHYNLLGQQSRGSEEEDQHLLYIALTRTKQQLHLLLEQQYMHLPSPYIGLEEFVDHDSQPAPRGNGSALGITVSAGTR